MRKLLQIILIVTATVYFAAAQRPTADAIKIKGEVIIVQPVYHGAVVITLNGKTIYVDPNGGGEAYQGLKRPDMILVTDIHQDHFDTATLKTIDYSQCDFIVPEAVLLLMKPDMKQRATVLANGKELSKGDIKITAIPMYNLPETPDSRHPKGRGNGYILETRKVRIYISGDTEDIPEMRGLKNIDIAFVCMNLPYTMDINQAADAVNAFKPAIVYPYHYRGKEGLSDVGAFKNLVEKAGKHTEVRLKDWYTKY
jgi:L-ascorbate metabolism protein UlaG (beta-lactamase superfamily)